MKYLVLPLFILLSSCSSPKTMVTTEQEYSVNTPQPEYPVEAAQKGMEGYVKLRFDIDEHGQTQQIRVLESSPANIFEQSAVTALSKWHFPKKIVNNLAVIQQNQTIKFDFELRDSSKSKIRKNDHIIKDPVLVEGIKKTFNFVTNNNLEQALSTACTLKPTTPYEQAFVDRILGLIYADSGDTQNAINYLTKAVESQLLAKDSQTDTIKRLAVLKSKSSNLSQ